MYDGVTDRECQRNSWCAWRTGFTPLVGFVTSRVCSPRRHGRMDSRLGCVSLTELIVDSRNELDAN